MGSCDRIVSDPLEKYSLSRFLLVFMFPVVSYVHLLSVGNAPIAFSKHCTACDMMMPVMCSGCRGASLSENPTLRSPIEARTP